jgi:hypothetical protein
MKTLKRRSRMVSIRLSEEEYLALCDLCSTTGAHSVSEMMRQAMHSILRSADRDGQLGLYMMKEFRSHIKDLDKRIEQLTVDLTSLKSVREG